MEKIIFYLILAFFSGVFVKIVDYIEDNKELEEVKKINSNILNLFSILLSVLYGILIGYLISQASFAMIFLAAILSQILVGKIDNNSHKLGLLFILLSLIYFGVPQLNILALVFFFALSSIDELDSLIFWRKPKWVQDFRPFLELASIPFIIFGEWQYFAGIFLFDLGYLVVRGNVYEIDNRKYATKTTSFKEKVDINSLNVRKKKTKRYKMKRKVEKKVSKTKRYKMKRKVKKKNKK